MCCQSSGYQTMNAEYSLQSFCLGLEDVNASDVPERLGERLRVLVDEGYDYESSVSMT